MTHPSAEVLTSTDLLSWTDRDTDVPSDAAGRWCAEHAAGVTMVGGGNGKLAVSYDDGTRWVTWMRDAGRTALSPSRTVRGYS